jgi:hypothetical protein
VVPKRTAAVRTYERATLPQIVPQFGQEPSP